MMYKTNDSCYPYPTFYGPPSPNLNKLGSTFNQNFIQISFVKSQRENRNSKGDFVLKNWFEMFVLKIYGNQE